MADITYCAMDNCINLLCIRHRSRCISGKWVSFAMFYDCGDYINGDDSGMENK